MGLAMSKTEISVEAGKAAPPLLITASNVLAGVDLNMAVALATLLYIGIQIAWLAYKWYRFAVTKDYTPDN